MKKFFLLLLMTVTLAAYSQQSNIYTVHMVKVKNGQKMAFEAAYKQHVAKFHKTDKVNVYEVMSGPTVGSYQIVSGPSSFADLDNERTDAMVHNIDLDKNFFAYLEDESMTIYARWEDSMSFHPSVQADKMIVNVRHLKADLQSEYYNEQKRSVKILSILKGKFWDNLSFNYFSQLWDGSNPVIVSIRNLKDGFKELEQGYFGPMNDGNPTFRDEYIKAHGTLEWDKRVKLLDHAVVSREQYIMKRRKDLSSQ